MAECCSLPNAVDAVRVAIKRGVKVALLLDFDGTLAPIVSDPSTSQIPSGAHAELVLLSGRLPLLAVLTGR